MDFFKSLQLNSSIQSNGSSDFFEVIRTQWITLLKSVWLVIEPALIHFLVLSFPADDSESSVEVKVEVIVIDPADETCQSKDDDSWASAIREEGSCVLQIIASLISDLENKLSTIKKWQLECIFFWLNRSLLIWFVKNKVSQRLSISITTSRFLSNGPDNPKQPMYLLYMNKLRPPWIRRLELQ